MAKARVLRKLVDSGFLHELSEGVFDIQGDGWEIISNAAGGQAFVWKGYIDLSGYAREDQTWFTQSVQIQGADFPLVMSPTIAGVVTFIDVVSEVPLSDQDLTDASTGLVFPGGPTSEVDLQQIIWGRIRYYSVDGTLSQGVGSAINIGSSFFGLNNGTSRDKLYLYRVINMVQLGVGDGVGLGECAFVIAGAVDKEPDLEYIMRLKRSYEMSGPFS